MALAGHTAAFSGRGSGSLLPAAAAQQPSSQHRHFLGDAALRVAATTTSTAPPPAGSISGVRDYLSMPPKVQDVLPKPTPAFRSSFVVGRPRPQVMIGGRMVFQAPEAVVAPPGSGLPMQAASAGGIAAQPLSVMEASMAARGSTGPSGTADAFEPFDGFGVGGSESIGVAATSSGPEAARRMEASRVRHEAALDVFLDRLPAWRGGHRDAGRAGPSGSPERERESMSGRSPRRGEKERSRRSASRPSPVPQPTRRGSRFDLQPGTQLAAIEAGAASKSRSRGKKKDKKDRKDKKDDRGREQDREKERQRERPRPDREQVPAAEAESPSPGRGRRKRVQDSRSPSRGKKRKEKDTKERKPKEKDREREGAQSHSRSRSEKRKNNDRDTQKEADRNEPDVRPVSPPPVAASAPTGAVQGGDEVTTVGTITSKESVDARPPEWLSDLFVQTCGGGSDQMLRPRVPHREVMVPQQFVARLIGRGGEVIMGICNATGADVKIRQETKEMGYSLAIITGPEEAMANAERMVSQKLGLPVPGIITKEVPLKPEQVNVVIGSKGATLSDIRMRAGGLQIEIRQPEGPGMLHRAVLGPGRQEQLAHAEQLITEKLAEAMAVGSLTIAAGPNPTPQAALMS